MKKFINCFVAGTVVTLVACQPKSNVPAGSSPPTPEVSQEGGITSGGGGTLPAQPISIDEAAGIISSSKQGLRLFLREQSESAFFVDRDEKFFQGDKNLSTVLEETDVEILKDRPCHDKFGHPTDGSIYASKPNAICISAFRVAPKLIEERAYIEIYALMIHEYSHLLGSTEPEAVALQKRTAEYLSHVHTPLGGSGVTMVGIAWDCAENIQNLKKSAIRLSQHADSETPDQLVYELLQFDKDFFDGIEKNQVSPLSFTDGKRFDLYELEMSKLDSMLDYVEGLSQVPHHDEAKKRYDDIFGAKSAVTYEEYERMLGSSIHPRSPLLQQKIVKLNSMADVKTELENLYEYLNAVWKDYTAVAYNETLPSGPWDISLPANPWSSYLGSYTITSKSCTQKGPRPPSLENDFTHIEFSLNANKVIGKYTALNGSIQEGFYNDAFDVNDLSVGVQSTSVGATRTAESDPWWHDIPADGIVWSKQTDTLIKLDETHYRLTHRMDLSRAKSYEYEKDTSECVFEMTKN